MRKGWNEDRHACKKCMYRARGNPREHNCNYILITEKRRECKVEDCDKYKRGKRVKERWERDEAAKILQQQKGNESES